MDKPKIVRLFACDSESVAKFSFEHSPEEQGKDAVIVDAVSGIIYCARVKNDPTKMKLKPEAYATCCIGFSKYFAKDAL